jgi:hypothetical protein
MWMPIAAWGAAALIAVVLLGFCAYEINWKAERLRRDLGKLQVDGDRLVELRGALAAAQERVAATGLR